MRSRVHESVAGSSANVLRMREAIVVSYEGSCRERGTYAGAPLRVRARGSHVGGKRIRWLAATVSLPPPLWCWAIRVLALLPLLAIPLPSYGVDPVVTAVKVVQRRDGAQLADATYRLTDADADTLWRVAAEVPADSGQTWTPIVHVSGDVGGGVAVGPSKHIVWDIGPEYPGRTGKGHLARALVDATPAGMVRMPAGCLDMRDAFSEGNSREFPVHEVCVDAFHMDTTEVTNAAYRRYSPGHSSGTRDGISLDDGMQPVVYVSWQDAVKYCNWHSRQDALVPVYDETTWAADLSQSGYRLPTEAEWEYSARGGLSGKRYPRGDDVSHDDANYEGTAGTDRWDVSSPVASFPANGYGLNDMAGNVWEWCHGWYGSSYYASSPRGNPTGSTGGSDHLVRGGSWSFNILRQRVTYRDTPSRAELKATGFRCVRPVAR